MMLSMSADFAISRLVPQRRFDSHRALVCAVIVVCCLAAHSQTKSSAGDKRLAAAVDRTMQHGHDAILPPHISRLLGLSANEQEVPIRQFAEMGELIRGFDVSIDNSDDIVIFVEDRSKNESTFYLTSPRGAVKKVLSVRAGVGYIRVPTADDKTEFQKQRQYWLDRHVPEQR
jgi:hypothetical protein